MYILQDGRGADVGQGRIDLRRGTVEISLALRPSSRGRGLGRAAIQSLTQNAFRSGARRVIARIKMDNPASVIAFIKAGFRFVRCAKATGKIFYLMEISR
jgi:RimJ/RimL family protein N-acetyltransferase